jgi:hypothetical protein
MEGNMKKLSIAFFGLVVVLFLTTAPTFAQRGGSAGVGGGHTVGGDQNHSNSSAAGKSDKAPGKEGKDKDDDKSTSISDKISSDPKLDKKVTSLLPMGTDLKTAASGFKNEGSFIAALHVSKNLNIPWDQLKAKMTGPNAESLGKAIHDLRPDLNPKQVTEEAKKAEKEAKENEHDKDKDA